MNSLKLIRALEIFWLVIGITAILLAGWQFYSGSNADAQLLALFSALAVVMYFLRRRQRIRMSKGSGQR